MSGSLQSPGVQVTIVDESFYNSAGAGTTPLIVIATQSNKTSPSGSGLAPYTVPSQAGKLFLATSQRDLIQNFGNPFFMSVQGTQIHGSELNEYGLWAAYSYLGIATPAYILRADIDLLELEASNAAPRGLPNSGTYWFDLTATKWGVFRANGSKTPGSAWATVPVTPIDADADVDDDDVPLDDFGSENDVAVVALTAANYLYEKVRVTEATFTGTISGTTLTATSVTGSLVVGQLITGAGVAPNTVVTAGSGLTLTVSVSQTVSSEDMSASRAHWFKIGTTEWKAAHPTVVTGTHVSASLSDGNAITISTADDGSDPTTVTLGADGGISDMKDAINTAAITDITASLATNGALVITNTAGGPITLANGSGTPLTGLGLTAGKTSGVAFVQNYGPSYPDGSGINSIWVKGNPANNGANWVVRYFNGTLGQWQILTAPFFPFDSTLDDGDTDKDATALVSLPNAVVGDVYVGFDTTTFDQQLRRWSGTEWGGLTYEADTAPPSTAPSDGRLWYNATLKVDIMVGNGENWKGYHHYYPNTDPNGVQISGSAPLFQSDESTALVDNDLWIDSTDLENYPLLYRWDATDQKWFLVDKTDQTTPFGIIWRDARSDSGPAFVGIENEDDYAPNSTTASDMANSDYVDPDAPDPQEYPAGMLLFNTRFSTMNVKAWRSTYFAPGDLPYHVDPNLDYTTTDYSVGNDRYVFPSMNDDSRTTTGAGTWVTASGTQTNGPAWMGRKAQRIMVVQALAAQVTANQDIRSEIVFFNLMCAPGYPELLSEFATLNADMKNMAFTILDTPIRLTPDGTSIQNWATNTADVAMTGDDGLIVSGDGRYMGIYYPWGLGTNLDGSEVMVPPSAVALSTIAYNDQVAYPWYAPAGFTRGLVVNAASVGYLSSEGEFMPTILNQGQRDVLYLNRINPIAYIPNRGLVVYGQKTLSPVSTAMDRINVARLANYISYHLDLILKPFLFEQNVTATRATVKATCERLFSSLVQLNGLYDYAVVCDKTNNTPDRIDRNELWVDCAIQPVKSVEFIYVPVRILNTQATVA